MTHLFDFSIIAIVEFVRFAKGAAVKDLSVGILNELYGHMLTDRQREFVRCYYDYDLSLGEIAEQNGMTRQAVADALKKGECTLRKFERQLGFRAKLDEVKSDVEAAKAMLADGDAAGALDVMERLLGKI